MSPAHIITRTTKTGDKRYLVRYRLGGAAYPLIHAGSFKLQKDARQRRDLINGEIAAGRDPRAALEQLKNPPAPRLYSDVAAQWLASRHDLRPSSRVTYSKALQRLAPTFGNLNVEQIQLDDVLLWVELQALDLGAATVRHYVSVLRQVLDFAAVTPNVARDKRVRLPRLERPIPEPPNARHVSLIVRYSPAALRLPIRLLEGTGVRVSELVGWEWGDVDEEASRIRVRRGKTAASRRWVQVPEMLMGELLALVPREDRDGRIFPGLKTDDVRGAMRRACKAAGIPSFTPHDLRHRYASVQIRAGVPVTDLSAQLGHQRKSETLDVYSHVILEDA